MRERGEPPTPPAPAPRLRPPARLLPELDLPAAAGVLEVTAAVLLGDLLLDGIVRCDRAARVVGERQPHHGEGDSEHGCGDGGHRSRIVGDARRTHGWSPGDAVAGWSGSSSPTTVDVSPASRIGQMPHLRARPGPVLRPIGEGRYDPFARDLRPDLRHLPDPVATA